MVIKVLSVGAKPPPNLQHLIDDYTKRLPRHLMLKWEFLKHGDGDALSSKQQESEKILSRIQPDEHVILLDETGKQLSSESFSKLIFSQRSVTFVIGGAYGVNDAVKQRADDVLSLSELVFPHQLVRLILAEQLYRAYTISIDHPYHHS